MFSGKTQSLAQITHLHVILFLQATSLNVYKNDEETFDYTEDKAYGKYISYHCFGFSFVTFNYM